MIVTAVLFTCAGQRVDIVTAFREAGATTIAVDVDQLAPALYHADRRALVPRVDDFGYIAALRELVELHDVRLIVPLTDLDHHVLADARDELGGALVLVSGVETVARCTDKYLAHQFFEEQGIGSPPTWLPTALPGDLRYPVLVKARRGFGSRHIYRAANAAELEFFLRYTAADSMVQAACLGTEYSIDVFCDLDARCLAAVPRTMIESKGGESIKGMTIKDPELIEFSCRVSEALRIIGPANVQCFREPDGRAARDRRQSALRRRLPAADRCGLALPGARARPRERRAARAAARRLSRGRRDDAVLLAGDPRGARTARSSRRRRRRCRREA